MFCLKQKILCGIAALCTVLSVQAEDKIMRVGAEPAYAPFEFIDEETKELTGFDIELIKAIAEVEGYDQGVAFNHAFVAPAADAEKFLPDIKLPAGVNRNTKIRDVGIKDAHLARLHLKDAPEAQPAIFIDDIDLRDMDMSTMPNYALDLIANDGMFLETQDGKYKAYVYINKANSGRAGATISMKRYTMY